MRHYLLLKTSKNVFIPSKHQIALNQHLKEEITMDVMLEMIGIRTFITGRYDYPKVIITNMWVDMDQLITTQMMNTIQKT